jgi:hypothetical protein
MYDEWSSACAAGWWMDTEQCAVGWWMHAGDQQASGYKMNHIANESMGILLMGSSFTQGK